MACGKEGGCGCCPKLCNKTPAPLRRRDNDYNVEDEYKVANFKRNMVSSQMNYSFLSTKAIQSMFDPRYISQSIVGKTWKIITVFLLLWIILQVLIQNQLFCQLLTKNKAHVVDATSTPASINAKTTPATTPKPTTLSSIKPKGPGAGTGTNAGTGTGAGAGTGPMCTPYQQKRLNLMIDEFHTNDKVSATYLVFLLGFYVKQLVARWWDQVKNLPEIDSILNLLSGLVFDKSGADKPETGVSPASLSLSMTVSRYALLSWTMCMSSISRPLNDNFNTGKSFIDKGLLTEEEFEQLQVGKSKDGWRDQWMIPLNWAICEANIASNKTKIIPKDHKNLVGALNKYQDHLRHLRRVDKNPLPALYKQAVQICLWSWLVMGVIASQGEMRSDGVLNAIVMNFPFYQTIKILLLFGWLKVSEMIRNPFGNDVNFDINVVEKLDVEIWKSSVAIKNIAQAV